MDAVDFPCDVYPDDPGARCDECWQPLPGPPCPGCDEPRLAVPLPLIRRYLRRASIALRPIRLARPGGHTNPCHITAAHSPTALVVLRACRAALVTQGLAVAAGRDSLEGTPYLRVRYPLIVLSEGTDQVRAPRSAGDAASPQNVGGSLCEPGPARFTQCTVEGDIQRSARADTRPGSGTESNGDPARTRRTYRGRIGT